MELPPLLLLNIAKFLRTPILKNICQLLLLVLLIKVLFQRKRVIYRMFNNVLKLFRCFWFFRRIQSKVFLEIAA